MNANAPLRVVVALCLPMISNGCADDAALRQSADTLGKLSAGVQIPDQPETCRKQFPYASRSAKPGIDAFTLIRREHDVIDKANQTLKLCSENYDRMRASFAKEPGTAAVPAP